MEGVHQFIKSMDPGRESYSKVLELQTYFRSRGLRSEIFVEDTSGATVGELQYSQHVRAAQKSGVLYHADRTSRLVDYLYRRPEPLMVWYYGVPGTQSLEKFSWSSLHEYSYLITQLEVLSRRTTLAISSSEHLDQELVSLGYERRAIVPITDAVSSTFCIALDENKSDSKELAFNGSHEYITLVVMGKFSPACRLEQIVGAVLAIERTTKIRIGLELIGTFWEQNYEDFIIGLGNRFGLGERVRVIGKRPDNLDVSVQVDYLLKFVTDTQQVEHDAVSLKNRNVVEVTNATGVIGKIPVFERVSEWASHILALIQDCHVPGVLNLQPRLNTTKSSTNYLFHKEDVLDYVFEQVAGKLGKVS